MKDKPQDDSTISSVRHSKNRASQRFISTHLLLLPHEAILQVIIFYHTKTEKATKERKWWMEFWIFGLFRGENQKNPPPGKETEGRFGGGKGSGWRNAPC